MKGHTGKWGWPDRIGLLMIGSIALVLGMCAMLIFWPRDRATNDELLDLIHQLAVAQGYTIYEIPKQTVPHGWEIAPKRSSMSIGNGQFVITEDNGITYSVAGVDK